MGRRTLSVMCCRVNPGPSLKSFIKKKKKINLLPHDLSFTYSAQTEKEAAAIGGSLP